MQDPRKLISFSFFKILCFQIYSMPDFQQVFEVEHFSAGYQTLVDKEDPDQMYVALTYMYLGSVVRTFQSRRHAGKSRRRK